MKSSLRTATALVLCCAVTGCLGPRAVSTPDFPLGRFQAWSDDAPSYRIYPGDTLALTVLTAPELDAELEVAPDGRISPPLSGEIMVADLTVGQAERALEAALAAQLRDPDLELRAIGFGSQRIFVGGEVGEPGVYDLPAGAGALEGVMMAGGFRNTAASGHVVILRRAPQGGAMLRVVDVSAGLRRGADADPVALQRNDVVFVPRSSIAEVNLFVQQYVRDALPVDFGFFYDLNGDVN